MEPVVRVGVACFVWKDGKFLMGRRRAQHGRGTWSVPGGHLEVGEAWADCAAREVAEETGMQITNARLLVITNDVFPESGKHYVSIWMNADWAGGEPHIIEPDKFANQGWYDFRSLPAPLFEPCWQNLRDAQPELFV
jgi:8-oxo-dGTP diphosphatase